MIFEVGQIVEDKKTGLRTIIIEIARLNIVHYIFYAPMTPRFLYKVFDENRRIMERYYKPFKHEGKHDQNL